MTGDLRIGATERKVLRDLAAKTAELAARPREEEKARLWTRYNDLQGVRPLLFCDPENGWNEIIPQDRLLCEKPLYRVWEMAMRKEIFWAEHMKDDRVIEPTFDIPYNYTDSGWGLSERQIGGEGGGAYAWEPPVQDYEADFSALSFPVIKIDHETTRKVVAAAEEILGDLLTVRLRGSWWWSLGMTWDFIRLRGLDLFMMDMYDNPGWVHRLMRFLSDGTMRKLDYLEENDLLCLNTEGAYVGSGGFGWTRELPQEGFDPLHVTTMDMWGFSESQETVGVSPEMFAEFVFPYQKPLLERFGLNCYGCCEPLDARWDVVRRIPRLRRVSVSPWADKKLMAEMLGKDYIYSLKPSPTPLAVPRMNEAEVRRALREDLHDIRGCRLEIIMKDNNTLGGNPNNAVRWCEIARREIDRIGG